jgi:putative DNA primase/helicase
MMRCAACGEVVDREVQTCPFCGQTPKNTLFALTDSGNAERLTFLHHDVLRYCPGQGWLVYDGKRWAPDVKDRVERLALGTVRNMEHELDQLRGGDKTALEVLQHIKKSESARGIRAMVGLARTDPRIVVTVDQLDADPWLLNVQNGTLDLRAGELRKHDPLDLITKVCACSFDPDARSELWERVLLEALGDVETVEFFQRVAGYCLTGSTCEERVFLPIGPGAGSKSTCVDALTEAMGDYATVASFETFLTSQRSGSAPRPDLARLVGTRLVVAGEADPGRTFAASSLKQMTGGDRVPCRTLFHEEFTFKPQCKIVLVANDQPHARDDDSGLWRRLVKIPFEHVVPKDKRDPAVKATLCNPSVSGAAILAFAVRGCLAWQRDGLGIPQRVEDATEAYRVSQDPLGDFFKELCFFADGAKVRRSALFDAYEAWVKENGIKFPLSHRSFADRLQRTHADVKDGGKSHGERSWEGIALYCDWPSANRPGADGALGALDNRRSLKEDSKGTISGGLPQVPPSAPVIPIRLRRRSEVGPR